MRFGYMLVVGEEVVRLEKGLDFGGLRSRAAWVAGGMGLCGIARTVLTASDDCGEYTTAAYLRYVSGELADAWELHRRVCEFWPGNTPSGN